MIKNGKIWPYAIVISITLIFGACVATIMVASKLPVEESDLYMRNYHDADAKANELIHAKIAFDQNYKIEYITDGLSQEASTVKYKLTDINGNSVNDAKIEVVVTRPNKNDFDKNLANPTVENGIYTFETITLDHPGRWDVMAKVNVGEYSRYYNVKADTRVKEYKEY